MYLDYKIAVVIPAYNEEKLIAHTLASIPDIFDHIIVVNDASTDRTAEILRREWTKRNPKFAFCEDWTNELIGAAIATGFRTPVTKMILREHEFNQGVGAAIATGYRTAMWCADITLVMAADNQMHPADLDRLLEPIIKGEADYAKGNRLSHAYAWSSMPRYRYFGGMALSILTRIAAGYWDLWDSQCGYTAITGKALRCLNLNNIYPDYGVPNDLLIKLGMCGLRVKDVMVRPVYGIGETSGIRLKKVIPRISWLLFKGFWKRLFYRYVLHPLVRYYYAQGFHFADL